jgi:hypothetical protein
MREFRMMAWAGFWHAPKHVCRTGRTHVHVAMAAVSAVAVIHMSVVVIVEVTVEVQAAPRTFGRFK